MHYDPAGLMFVCLVFEDVYVHCFVFKEMVSTPNKLLRLDDKYVEQLMTIARRPGGGVAGVPVDELDKWNFNFLVYYVKPCDLSIRRVVLAGIIDNDLVTLHDNAEKSPPMITQTHITKNIDLVWEIVNEHLEAICSTKIMPVIWCVFDTVFPKYHRVEPALYYISIDK